MLSVSALSAYVRCPRQFFVHYVLKEALPPKDVVVLGLIKHKVYEELSKVEEKLVSSVLPGTNVFALFRAHLMRFLQDSVKRHKSSLRQVGVPLVDAFKSCLPAVEFEARSRSEPVSRLVGKGFFGQDLWSELSPKVRSEYVVRSERLGLSGRIDCLECYPDYVVPVELKSGTPPRDGVWDSHRIQAASYALLLSDKFCLPVKKAVVHYVDHALRRDVVMNPFLEDWVLTTRDACLSVFESKLPPKGCGREGCPYCSRKL